MSEHITAAPAIERLLKELSAHHVSPFVALIEFVETHKLSAREIQHLSLYLDQIPFGVPTSEIILSLKNKTEEVS